MAYCVKCGAKVWDGAKFCPECGAEIPETKTGNGEWQQNAYGGQDEWNYSYQGGQSHGARQYYQYQGEVFPAEEIQKNKGMAVLSYIGFLVLIPLFAGDRSSEYLRQHLNQGFSLWVVSLVINMLAEGSFFGYRLFYHHAWGIAGNVLSLAVLTLAVVGIVRACRGTRKPLPIVGGIRIFK